MFDAAARRAGLSQRDRRIPSKSMWGRALGGWPSIWAPLVSLGAKSADLDERYFGLHHDLPPETIARRLGGELVWKKEDQGQWVALIRFNRVFDAADSREASKAGE